MNKAEQFVSTLDEVLITRIGPLPCPQIYQHILTSALDLYIDDYFLDPQPPPQDALGLARYKDERNALNRRLSDANVHAFTDAIVTAYIRFCAALPPICFLPTTGSTTIPLSTLVNHHIVDALISPFENAPFELFKPLKRQVERNRLSIKEQYRSKDYSPLELIRFTPFFPLFQALVPFSIPPNVFKEHGFLFAKSGWGKSQSMRAIVTQLIEEDCALFLIDGNGSLIENVEKIASIQDRLVILDPRDKPALNFFKLSGGSREKQMELFFYLFKALDQGLTQRQATMISYLVDLMQVIPRANLDTLRQICEADKTSFPTQYLPLLHPITQDFFQNQFMSKDQLVNQTKAQIAQRLYTVSRNQLFADMFNATENKFNALDLMQQKKIVVVDATRNDLGDQGSAIFQRYILAQCLAAAFQRPKDARHLALIVLDEAKTSLDDQSQKILSDARAFGLGLLLCSQFPDQLDDGVRKEVINNTSIKLAGPASFSVTSQLYRDMRCPDPSFILNMKKKDYHYTEWACYVDNLTPQAIKLTVPFGLIEKLPRISDAQHRAMRERNRLAFASTHEPASEDEGSRELRTLPPEGDTPIVPPPATTNRTVNKVEPKVTQQKKPEPTRTDTSSPDYDTDH